jgi:hypothetical protein
MTLALQRAPTGADLGSVARLRLRYDELTDAVVDAAMAAVGAPLLVLIASVRVRDTGRSLFVWEQWLAYAFASWLAFSAFRHIRRALRILRLRRQ